MKNACWPSRWGILYDPYCTVIAATAGKIVALLNNYPRKQHPLDYMVSPNTTDKGHARKRIIKKMIKYL